MRIALVLFLAFVWAVPAIAGRIELSQTDIKVDGVALPYLFGAETQYFRARGGTGPKC